MVKEKHGYSARPDGARRKGEDDGCCMHVMDTYVWCSTVCCPARLLALALPALATAAFGSRAGGADPAALRPSGWMAGRLYEAVRHYRSRISPSLPDCCPYTPTCSTYAVKALHRHGAWRGGLLTVRRLLRCRPGAARRRGYVDHPPL
ncbi:membrane protein insertion efficiency factor YidD [Streptomyces mesophilus]|uniref:membrane protein insertion efficiency factor YidD n=1 Tax=Streptomyces mesophilus TaxID=1775132 RepID=UPI0033344515